MKWFFEKTSSQSNEADEREKLVHQKMKLSREGQSEMCDQTPDPLGR